MKKLFAICLALVLMLSLSVSVMAANNFVNSPSNNRAPIVNDCENENEDCTADIVITPFGDRDNLTEEQKKDLQDAYDSIVNTEDLTDLFNGLDSVLTPGTIKENLSISDLFYVDHTGCLDHTNHGKFQINLSTETLTGFVGLVQYVDGKWQVITDAKVDGNKLSFTTDKYSPVAIVVDRSKAETTSPITGAPTANYAMYVAVAAVVFAGIASVLVIKKKHEKA